MNFELFMEPSSLMAIGFILFIVLTWAGVVPTKSSPKYESMEGFEQDRDAEEFEEGAKVQVRFGTGPILHGTVQKVNAEKKTIKVMYEDGYGETVSFATMHTKIVV